MSAIHHKYLSSPFFDFLGTGKTLQETVTEFYAGYDARAAGKPHSSHVTAPLEAYRDTINAWASIIIPADPLVPGDKAAGDLVGFRPDGGTEVEERISEQIIRWVRVGFVADIGVNITEHDAQSTFHFIDGKAIELHGVKFHEATVAQQQAIVTQILADGYGDASLKFEAQLTTRVTHLSYWLNWPEHRVRRNPLGMGTPGHHHVEEADVTHLEGEEYLTVGGAILFTQPEYQISSPNVPGTGTSFDYTSWYYPLKKSVEDLITLAILEAEAQPAASEAALAELIAAHNDGSLALRDE
jgi:hypothetical protein